jgi:putative transposase
MLLEWESTSLSVRRQCELLDLNRSTAYYEPIPAPPEELRLMRLIDEQYLKTPFYGSRRMTDWLEKQGWTINRKRVQRVMRLMGLEGLAPGPSTSRPHPEHVVYPYLLKGLKIERANHVWATDITYIPMAQGFMYLVAIMDWFSRYVLSFRLSNTLDVAFCIDALQEALGKYGTPEIFNSDQGSHFTSKDFTALLKAKGVSISMDGKGRCLDNIFVERLWRSLKYEEVYLHAYQGMVDGRLGIGRWFGFYNEERSHQALGYRTPGEIYRGSLLVAA